MRGALADAAVGDGVLAPVDAGLAVDGLQLVVGLEGAVLVGGLAPGDVLGAGDFLLRVYQDSSRRQPYVDLFLAYFPSQRTGDTIHSPKHCLPGSGWLPVESSRVTLALPGHSPFLANRYVIAKGTDRQLVLYWYLAPGVKLSARCRFNTAHASAFDV